MGYRVFAIRRVVSFALHMGVEISTVEAHHPVAPGLLRHIESVVRRFQQRFLIFDPWMRRRRHPAAHCPAKHPARVLKIMARHLLPQPLGERYRRIEYGAGKDEEELLAA